MTTSDPKILSKSWRLSHLYKIVDKNAQTTTFKRNQAQEKLNAYMKELKEQYGCVRLIILKARQLGVTTDRLLDGLDDCMMKNNQNIVITAHSREKQKEIFQKVKYSYQQIPEALKTPKGVWYKPKPKYDNVNELYFPNNNSKIQVSLDSRSGTPSKLHITELAFRTDAREMMAGTLPSIPKQSDIVIETTANGVGNYFYEMRYKYYGRDDGEFKTIFIARWFADEYRVPVLPGEQIILPLELQHLSALDLDDEQKKRYLQQYDILGRDVFQEYPSTPEEAFLTTGDTVFSLQIVKNLSVLSYTEDEKIAKLRIYRPATDHCLFGVDTAEGGKDGDNSCIQVRDQDLNLLACYYGTIPPDMLCEVIDRLVELGYTGIIGIERNNTGLTTITKAKDYKRYAMLYAERTIDKISNQPTRKYGRQTNTKTRPLMINEYEEAIRRGFITQVDERHRTEMYSFIYNEKHKPEAQEGTHDDAIMADAICYQMRKELAYDMSRALHED
ncbi:MAG TPA: hypothetical protein PK048_01405 [Candidatus Absconditabacterales bacterium]|nr:hypothetical protein [Candidatus Absconditabacterales bacterium]